MNAQTATTEPVLLRIEEAARRIAVSRATFYRLIDAGQVRTVRIGAARRVPVDALADYVDSLRAA